MKVWAIVDCWQPVNCKWQSLWRILSPWKPLKCQHSRNKEKCAHWPWYIFDFEPNTGSRDPLMRVKTWKSWKRKTKKRVPFEALLALSGKNASLSRLTWVLCGVYQWMQDRERVKAGRLNVKMSECGDREKKTAEKRNQTCSETKPP